MLLFFSLYNYKVFCTEHHNKAMMHHGNCEPGYTEDIIASNRSILLPELDARLNDSVCKGKLCMDHAMSLLISFNCPGIHLVRFQAGITFIFIYLHVPVSSL